MDTMCNARMTCLAVMFAVMSTTAVVFANPPARAAVLLQSEGYVHDVVKPADGRPSVVEQTLTSIAERTNTFDPTFTRDANDVTPDRLADTDLLILYTTGPIPLDVDALDQWIQDGGALLGIHCATDTLKDHPLYPRIIGGTFNGHPWNADTIITLKVHDPAHPAATCYAPGATFREEIYQFRNLDPTRVRVLMGLDMERTEPKRPYHVPIAWCRDYGKGRVLYTSLGHRQDVWESDAYHAHLSGAIDWLLGRADGDATPNPQVHLREGEIARAAFEGRSVDEQPPPTGGRPRDPWVFRSVLDGNARMVTVALHEDLWLAYDAADLSLDKAWSGGVEFQGAVFDGRHGPQPESVAATTYYENPDGETWRVFQGTTQVPITIRYRGYRLQDDTVTLFGSLVLPDGAAIDVEETPEVQATDPDAVTLLRRVRVGPVPPGYRVSIRTADGPDKWVQVDPEEGVDLAVSWTKEQSR